jgi:hypothetical protein
MRSADSTRHSHDVPVGCRGSRDLDRHFVPRAAVRDAAPAVLRGGPSDDVSNVGSKLIDNLGLLLVPAGNAIVVYASRFATDGLAILAASVASSLLAVLVGGAIVAKWPELRFPVTGIIVR